MSDRRRYRILACLVCAFWACDGSPSVTYPGSTGVELSASTLSFAAIEDTVRLQAEVRDEQGNALGAAILQWTTRNEKVADVSHVGLVTATGNGQTWIVATSGGSRDSTEVAVAQVTTTVVISPAGDSIWTLGGTAEFTARPFDANGHETPHGPARWALSDTSIATIDQTGTATGLEDGVVTLSATIDGGSAEVPLVIDQRGAVRVAFVHDGGGTDPDGYMLSIGGRPASVSAKDPTIVGSIPAGANDLDVTGLAQHCAWRDDGQPVHITKGDTTDLVLEVRCIGPYAYASWADGVTRLAYSDEFGVSTILSADEIVRGHVSWAPNGAWLAYSKTVGGNTDVYVIRPDGTDEHRLTTHPGRDLSPTWSPDGGRIAYRSEETAAAIWVVDHEGTNGNEIRSLELTSQLRGPVWSPTEDLIAFVGPTSAGNAQLWTMRSDGSDAEIIGVNRWTLEPAWSPDGEKIVAFMSGFRAWELVVTDKTGLDRLVVATSGQAALDLSWSPDGSRIAYTGFDGGRYGAYVVGADGSGQLYLSPDLYSSFTPTFSRDGSYVLFRGPSAVMAVDVDGDLTSVVSTPGGHPLPRPGG